MAKRIELTREEYRKKTGITPQPDSIGAIFCNAARDRVLIEFVFKDGSERDDLERLGRLVDPR